MSKPKMNDLSSVRFELENLFVLAKQGLMNASQADKCAGILRTIAGILKDERELDIEAQLDELRASIAALKGEPVGE